MKQIIIILSFLFVSVFNTYAKETDEQLVQSSVEINGTYTYSTDNTGGTYRLESDCYLKKTSMTVFIQMEELSDGMYYEWYLYEADGYYDFQPQANKTMCYIGLNGTTNKMIFLIRIRNSSGDIVNARYFTFRFNENY